MESSFSPREIVSELDKFIIGQQKAKRAVAVALRNRWRRKQLPENLRYFKVSSSTGAIWLPTWIPSVFKKDKISVWEIFNSLAI